MWGFGIYMYLLGPLKIILLYEILVYEVFLFESIIGSIFKTNILLADGDAPLIELL
jgi:hypothetical protein